jgi:hypothetical protein
MHQAKLLSMKHGQVFRFLVVLCTFCLPACLKQEAAGPPDTSSYDPRLPVTATIAELKAMNGYYNYRTGGDTTVIITEVTVAGIVTANDKSGNFYQAVHIEDSTGGIQVMIDGYSLYASYPVGRKVYVVCRGLMLGYSAGTPVLGAGVDEQMSMQPITGSKVAAHVIKADVGHQVTPKVVTLGELTATSPDRSLLNCLVRMEDVEFTDSLSSLSYAQPNAATSRNIRDCASREIAVRTSNYASFAAICLPGGKGSVTGLFSIYTSAVTGRITHTRHSDFRCCGQKHRGRLLHHSKRHNRHQPLYGRDRAIRAGRLPHYYDHRRFAEDLRQHAGD